MVVPPQSVPTILQLQSPPTPHIVRERIKRLGVVVAKKVLDVAWHSACENAQSVDEDMLLAVCDSGLKKRGLSQ